MRITYRCDTKTENGIPYSSTLYALNSSRGFDYKVTVDSLENLYPMRMQIMSGGGPATGYAISSGSGSRSVTRSAADATKMLAMWDELMEKKRLLEMGGSSRKAVAAVPRDW